MTEAQINALQDGCDAKGRKAYMQNGGNEDDYMMEMEKGASTAAGSVAENCFDAAFLREGLRYLFFYSFNFTQSSTRFFQFVIFSGKTKSYNIV